MDTADRRFRRIGAGFDDAVKNGKYPYRLRYGNLRISRPNRCIDSDEWNRAQHRKHLPFYLVAAHYRSRRTHNSFYRAVAENRMD